MGAERILTITGAELLLAYQRSTLDLARAALHRDLRWVVVRTNKGERVGRVVMRPAYTSKTKLRIAIRNPDGRTRTVVRRLEDVRRLNSVDPLEQKQLVRWVSESVRRIESQLLQSDTYSHSLV